MEKNNLSKGILNLKNAAYKAGEKLSGAAKESANALLEKKQEISDVAKIKNFEARMKKYNPLFPDKYQDTDFHTPGMIRIVDSSVRKDVDVCEGSIGWLSTEKNVEVMHLYSEAVNSSNLQFLPMPIPNAVYYIHPYNDKIFIDVDSYFSTMLNARLVELENIAFSLGAKSYSVEMVEKISQSSSAVKSFDAKFQKNKTGFSQSNNDDVAIETKTVAKAVFGTGREPKTPQLCWFANDSNITNLINMRCSGEIENSITSYDFELNNSCSHSMSSSTAIKLDTALKGMGISSKFESESFKEHNSKTILHLEF